MSSTTGEPPPRGTPLSQILAALAHEFTRAGAGHDATLAAWSQIYSNQATFSGRTPTSLQIVTAEVTLPVVVAEVGLAARVEPRLTAKGLAEILPREIPKAQRQEIGQRVVPMLASLRRDGLLDPKLSRHVRDVLRREFPDLPLGSLAGEIARLREEAERRTEAPPELRVLFRSEDMAAAPREHVMVLNLGFRPR